MIQHRPLHRFMNARHKIYLLRKKGVPAPWTNDAVLSSCFFTNVYRELDKVTIWVRQHIREPFANDPHLPFYLCVARHFNLPSTLQLLIDKGAMGASLKRPWDGKLAKLLLKRARMAGDTIYTGAYLVSTAGLSMDKVDYSIDKVFNPLFQATCAQLTTSHVCAWAYGPTLEAAHKLLSCYYGWAGFMAYEVVCDLRYTSFLEKAKDKRTWANPGPGAKRGINRLLGNGGTTRGLPVHAYVEYMQELLHSIEAVWDHKPALELREIEHSLCEFDKYERVRLNEGAPRSRYRPPQEPSIAEKCK